MLHRPSFISFGVIKADEIISVYQEGKRNSVCVDPESNDIHTLDIPGLLIQHTRSIHDHLPCVDDVDEVIDDDEFEEVVEVTTSDTKIDGLTEECTSISQQSSYEILMIPCKSNSLEDLSKVTLVHVIDDVLYLSPKVSLEKHLYHKCNHRR